MGDEIRGRSVLAPDGRVISDDNLKADLADGTTLRASFDALGRMTDREGVSCRRALPCDGNPGGEIEYLVPDPKRQINVPEIIHSGRPF